MGEELGWRGFCLPLLLKKYNPVKASIILGLIQAFWHLPIDITSSDIPALMVLFRIGWAIPITIIFTWVYLNSPANLLTALLLHTSVNVLPDIGFSNYERTMFLFVLFVVVLSSIIARTPIMQSIKPA
ncbi:CPBP family intramembrane glutamic endopeptidase [Acidobacteriota bacterium]